MFELCRNMGWLGWVGLPLAGFLGGCHGLSIVVTVGERLRVVTLDILAHGFVTPSTENKRGFEARSNMRRSRGPRAERFGFSVMFASRAG